MKTSSLTTLISLAILLAPRVAAADDAERVQRGLERVVAGEVLLHVARECSWVGSDEEFKAVRNTSLQSAVIDLEVPLRFKVVAKLFDKTSDWFGFAESQAKDLVAKGACSQADTRALWEQLLATAVPAGATKGQSTKQPSAEKNQDEQEAKELPPGAIQKGSLANPKLIRDAMIGVAGKAATLGCQSIDSHKPYVVALPTGSPGSQVWHEKWVVSCQGQYFPIDIRFNESGPGAADYQIK